MGSQSEESVAAPAGCEGTSHRKLLCPSAPANVNAILLGVVRADGSVAFIKDRIKVTREFVDIAAASGTPENRFRFGSGCIERGCQQWSNGACSLPDRLAELVAPPDTPDAPLPSCSIRDQCRWFEQRGADACRICPVIVTRGDRQ